MNRTRTWLVAFFLFVIGMWVAGALNWQSYAQPVFREGNKLMEQVRFSEMDRSESAHFSILSPASLRQEAAQMLDVAERVYETFNERYDFPVESQIPLVLFADQDSMRERFGWQHEKSASAVYYGGVIYLLSSDAWSDPYVPMLDDTAAWQDYVYKQGPIAHELAHYYLDWRANGNFPHWFTEAFAQTVEYDLVGYEWISLNNCLHCEPLYTYEELERAFDQLDNQALAYRQVFMWYRYLQDTHGLDAMHELHDRISDRTPFSRAWHDVFGESEDAMLHDWRDKVREAEIR